MTKPELETCIAEHGKAIYSFCRYLTGSVQEAEDLYQDTFLKAVEHNGQIDSSQNPKSYLLSVALRIWKNKKRKYAWRKRIADMHFYIEEKDVEPAAPILQSPEEQVLQEEEAEAVRRSVAKLPDRLKTVVLLYYMEGLTVAQTAAAARLAQGTVKSRLFQARKLLEKELEVVFNEKRY